MSGPEAERHIRLTSRADLRQIGALKVTVSFEAFHQPALQDTFRFTVVLTEETYVFDMNLLQFSGERFTRVSYFLHLHRKSASILQTLFLFQRHYTRQLKL